MPASMISAPTGATLKVIGNSIAMVASGPMPGSTPIKVPTETPIRQYSRFCQEKATSKPKIRLWNSSIASPARDQRVRKAEPEDEQHHRKGSEAHRQQQRLAELELAARRG